MTGDSYRQEHRLEIGFIKADLEGMGVAMLEGMQETLRQCRPVLSLSIYHNKDEFINTKLTLEKLDLNYRISIISLTPNMMLRDLTLFAVPAELYDAEQLD